MASSGVKPEMVPGVPCPACGHMIVATVQQILSLAVVCPSCKLVLKVDTERSRDMLDELRLLNAQLESIPRV